MNRAATGPNGPAASANGPRCAAAFLVTATVFLECVAAVVTLRHAREP